MQAARTLFVESKSTSGPTIEANRLVASLDHSGMVSSFEASLRAAELLRSVCTSAPKGVQKVAQKSRTNHFSRAFTAPNAFATGYYRGYGSSMPVPMVDVRAMNVFVNDGFMPVWVAMRLDAISLKIVRV
jgi:hypothetical protein